MSLLPYSATTWTHVTWMGLTLSRTTLYIFVWVWRLASTDPAMFMHRLCCLLKVSCVSIQSPRQCVAWFLNCMMRGTILIFAASSSRRYWLYCRLHVKSDASVVRMSNCSLWLLTQLIPSTAVLLSMVMTQLTLLPVVTQPMSSRKDHPLAADMYSWTHFINAEV